MQPVGPMAKDLQSRFLFVVIALLSVAAVVFAWLNFQKDSETLTPYDGVWWVENGDHLQAQRVDVNGPGEKAGIKQGDVLMAVNGHDILGVGSLEQQFYRTGVWSKATYSLVRRGIPLEAPLILVPADRSLYIGLRLIALVYLGIGLYVLLRRWTAPKSTHFYVFCLVSFIFYSFHYTGKFNDFDWIIYWANVVAWMLQPALFLHFSLTFPERQAIVNRRRWLIPSIYVPGALILAAQIAAVRWLRPSETLRFNLDRLQMVYLAAYFVAATVVLWHSYRHGAVSDPAPANEMGHARNPSLGRALHAVLRHPVLVRERAHDRHEDLGTVAGVPAADLRLRHLPLPPDGRGPDLQARHGLYHRRGRDYGRVLRLRRRHLGDLPQELSQRGIRSARSSPSW